MSRQRSRSPGPSRSRALRLGTALGLAALLATALGTPAAPAVGPRSSAPLDWVDATPPAPSAAWSVVGYGGGRWVTLSPAGVAAESADGSTWTEHPAPPGSWQSLAYGDGEFVALSSVTGRTEELISTDGVRWTPLAGPVGPWTSVTFGGGVFVAVSAHGQVVTSPDGRTWTTRWSHPNYDLTSVAFGGGHYVAVDAALGATLISADGVVWSRILPAQAGVRWGAVAYGNGNFVALDSSGASDVETSVYGYVWAVHASSPLAVAHAEAFGCGQFVAVGTSASGAGGIASSWSGQAWVPATGPATSSGDWVSVAYGGHVFVALDSAGDLASSRAADCAGALPSTPRQVSGNVHSHEVWTYMHPSAAPGGARVTSYEVTISDGTVTRQCVAPVSFQPNCIIRGLTNGEVYTVTAQARNRFGYSVTTDPEFVIPVATARFDAVATPRRVPSGSPVVIQVTGVVANSEGIYPVTLIDVHVGARLETCRPNPFGECVLTFARVPAGVQPVYATYTGYGVSYRSPTTAVVVTP